MVWRPGAYARRGSGLEVARAAQRGAARLAEPAVGLERIGREQLLQRALAGGRELGGVGVQGVQTGLQQLQPLLKEMKNNLKSKRYA